MRSAVSPLQLVRPRTLAEALAAMAETELKPIAGCTDVYVQLEFGQMPATRYIDLWPLDELRGISTDGDTLRLGALTTYSDIQRSAVVHDWLPMLVDAASQVGGIQIQNRGTIGGNIGNGSPAGDSLPVFACADAVIVAQSAKGVRRIPLTQFYSGYRQTVLRSDELIAAVEVPRVSGKQWFRKVGTRQAQAISKIVLAAVRAAQPRIAIGSVAATVVRLPKTEAALASGSLDDALLALQDEIAPIDDVRSSADYRKQVSANLLRRFWNDTAS